MASPGEFVSSLNEDTLKKARTELNEDPDKRDEVLLDFKKAIEENEGNPWCNSITSYILDSHLVKGCMLFCYYIVVFVGGLWFCYYL